MKETKQSHFDFFEYVMKKICIVAKKKNWSINHNDLNLIFGRDLKISEEDSKSSIIKELEKRGLLICQRKLKYDIIKIDIPILIRRRYSSC